MWYKEDFHNWRFRIAHYLQKAAEVYVRIVSDRITLLERGH